jgi:hypothetical protein
MNTIRALLWLGVVALCCVAAVGVQAATPSVYISGGGDRLLGASATFQVTMSNSDASGPPGYYPFVDVVFRGARVGDPTAQFTQPYLSWSYVSGVDTLSSDPLTVYTGILPSAPNKFGTNLSCVAHPFHLNSTGDAGQICGEPGEIWLSASFHISPLTSIAPASTTRLSFPCSLELNNIDELPLETVLIKARSGFRYVCVYVSVSVSRSLPSSCATSCHSNPCVLVHTHQPVFYHTHTPTDMD